MTTHKTLKHRVRARMEKTGERYTAARRNVTAAAAAPSPTARREAAPSAPPPVSDEAVRKATGRGWDEWFAILDDAGAVGWKHPDIARWVVAEHGISGWWAQSVTVGFERARGLRAEHERPSGFSLSATKTVQRPGRAAVRGVRRCEAAQRLAGPCGPRPVVDGTADHQPRLGGRLAGRRALHGAGPGQVPGRAPAGAAA